jgi:hypothetical protein
MQEEFFSTNQTHLLEINREVDKVIRWLRFIGILQVRVTV